VGSRRPSVGESSATVRTRPTNEGSPVVSRSGRPLGRTSHVGVETPRGARIDLAGRVRVRRGHVLDVLAVLLDRAPLEVEVLKIPHSLPLARKRCPPKQSPRYRLARTFVAALDRSNPSFRGHPNPRRDRDADVHLQPTTRLHISTCDSLPIALAHPPP